MTDNNNNSTPVLRIPSKNAGKQKFMKLTDHACAYNYLTNFEYEGHAMTENRKLRKSAETCIEKLMKSHQVDLFLAGFSHLESL